MPLTRIRRWETQQRTYFLFCSTPRREPDGGIWEYSQRHFIFSFYSSTDRTPDTASQIICHSVIYLFQPTTRTASLPAGATQTGGETRRPACRWRFVQTWPSLMPSCNQVTSSGPKHSTQYSHCKYTTYLTI